MILTLATLLLAAGQEAKPSPEIQKLLGPWTPVASAPAEILDQVLLKRGREFAAQMTAKPGADVTADGILDFGDHHFYDLSLVLYRNWYRTGDPAWRDRARESATLWRDFPANQKFKKWLEGDWKLWKEILNQPRNLGTVGLAVFALETGDADAKRIVGEHAKMVEQAWMYGPYQSLTDPVMTLGDPRECGYGLIALVAATVVGEDHRKSAKDLVDHVLKAQKPDGQWLSKDEKIEGGGYTSNFMTGILMEALLLYDRAIGDERILAAIEKSIAWMWSTQWIAEKEGFKYHSVNEMEAQPGLNGLILPAWGYAYFKTGKAAYLEQGNAIAKGLAERGTKEIWGVKQYNQIYRSSPQFAGYVALRGK